MSNTANSPAQIISLPKGAGAQRGLGEKFVPDLHTGTGNFTVPIAVPQGRNGVQPQLNLAYSTGNGNGPFGLGWVLSIPGVRRRTSKGIPRYDDSADVFVLSGAEDLVPIEAAADGTTGYRPRTEGLFARILHRRGPGTDYWEVRTKDGLVSDYGTAGAAGNDPAVVADPVNRSHVFDWKLTRTLDPFGNRIEYAYGRDAVRVDGPHQWDQLYLSEIRYADFADGDTTRFVITVRFFYEERPDPFSEYRAGFEIRTTRRCSRIEIVTNAGRERLVRSYNLVYLDQRDELVDRLPLNGVSLLSEIRVVGHDGDLIEELPPLEFGYTPFDTRRRDFFPLEGTDLPAHSLANPDLELVDLFGYGLPDILEMNGTVRYWRNLGAGRFDLPRPMRGAPGGFALADSGVQLIDADGDGRSDLLVTTETLSGYFPLQFGGLWNSESFRRYRSAPTFDLEDPEVKLVDLNGDGVTDAIRSGSRLECFFNDPEEGWNSVRWVERQTALEDFPDINFSDPRVKWADMSGDGLQDIVLVCDGNVEYWPNLGHGNWAKRVSMRNSPRFAYGYDPRRILVGDVDGDGLADIVFVGDTEVTLWINQAGNRWSAPIVITGTPPLSDIDAVRLVDLVGSGISGVLWTADAGALSRDRYFFLDFTGGLKPYLLGEMNNHMGAVTRVEYAPSTRFFLDDEKRLDTRWKTQLPFPVQVVARVEVLDEISRGKLTTEYRYHNGYWDGAEREFRGFGRVEQLDTESFARYHQPGLHGQDVPFVTVNRKYFSPPTLTKTWFHLGPVGEEFGVWQEMDWSNEYWPGDRSALSHTETINRFLKTLRPAADIRRVQRDALRALRGSILRTELFAVDGTDLEGNPYTVTEHAYDLREISRPGSSTEGQPHVFFRFVVGQRTTQWERGDDPMTQFVFTGAYDDFGQPQSLIAIAVPKGREFRVAAAPGEPYLATHALTRYAQPNESEGYIADRVASTATFEVPNDGSASVFGLKHAIENLEFDVEANLIGHTVNFYDGEAFTGREFGEIGKYGALVRTESLVLTQRVLAAAYPAGDPILTGEEPPHFAHEGTPEWPGEYPRAFADANPTDRHADPTRPGLRLTPLRYGYTEGGDGYFHGYYAATARRRYDFHADDAAPHGLLLDALDPLAHDASSRRTSIAYDRLQLLPTEVIDPAGLTTTAAYDERVLQPSEVTDANGNRTAFAYTPLGLLDRTAVMGKTGETLGDTLAIPGTRLFYDLRAFADRGQPMSVRTSRRVHHVNEADVPLSETDETIDTVEYSDGFGRLLQTRSQAEDVLFGDGSSGDAGLPVDQSLPRGDAIGRRRQVPDPLLSPPNVTVAGWQVYDNKGRVVEKYEPFFSEGWPYVEADRQRGQKATLYYDPRGHVVRTVNPDFSEQRVIYGVPASLDEPDEFSPSPWEAYTYDANDNAGRTHPVNARAYDHHWNTPASVMVDALGRPIEAIERNRERGDPLPPVEEYSTRTVYDLRGNVLTLADALGRDAFRYQYDLANRPLRIENIDAGVRRIVLDAAGNEVERRDSKGALILRDYDVLSRPIRIWARDGSGQVVTQREHLTYGDDAEAGLPDEDVLAANLRGKLYRHYDEAGLLAFAAYDFKGNVLEKTRKVIANSQILAVFDAPAENGQVSAFRVDWRPGAGSLEERAATLLDPAVYEITFTYDALNRIRSLRYPRDTDGGRKELRPAYNRAGALDRVALDGATYVERIAYNARGQRLLVGYGNGVMTRHVYDPLTFRLVRLCTERFSKPDALTYQPEAGLFQDFAYRYDLAGNITSIHDRTPGSGVPNTMLGAHALDRTFAYDPLYRLGSATGREHALAPPDPPWTDTIKTQDVNLTRGYVERYQYDRVGNLMELAHQADDGSYTRTFAMPPGRNQLATLTIAQTTYAYTYDANGNMTGETSSRHFEWDHNDRMRVFRIQPNGSSPTVHAQYLYDGAGQRVKKLVRKQNGQPTETTVYIDAVFEHHLLTQADETEEHSSLHVVDDKQRVALVRVGAAFSGDITPAVKYRLGDHLGSSSVVIGGDSAAANDFINREEYLPYGETSFGSFARKRYRFTGKERDEESGLNYHGARYYAPWLGRWIGAEASNARRAVPSSYRYGKTSPARYFDPDGHDDRDNAEREFSVGEGLMAYGMTEMQFTLQSTEHAQGNALAAAWNQIPAGPRHIISGAAMAGGSILALPDTGGASAFGIGPGVALIGTGIAEVATSSTTPPSERARTARAVESSTNMASSLGSRVGTLWGALRYGDLENIEESAATGARIELIYDLGRAAVQPLRVMPTASRITGPLTQIAKNELREEARQIAESVLGRLPTGSSVHHRIPLEYAHLFPEANPNRLENLIVVIDRQAREAAQMSIHDRIHELWRAHINDLRSGGIAPTAADIENIADQIDLTIHAEFGQRTRFVGDRQ